jgi:hypothetical protein
MCGGSNEAETPDAAAMDTRVFFVPSMIPHPPGGSRKGLS